MYMSDSGSHLNQRHHVMPRDDLPELFGVAGQVLCDLEHLEGVRGFLESDAGVGGREPEGAVGARVDVVVQVEQGVELDVVQHRVQEVGVLLLTTHERSLEYLLEVTVHGWHMRKGTSPLQSWLLGF